MELPPPTAWRQLLGQQYERTAQHYLEARGLVLLTANYRCRLGEIDLVMLEHCTLVFIEVRFRKSSSHGSAVATVDRRKQTRIRQAARHFLHTHKRFNDFACRFDVLGIEGHPQQGAVIQWIANAFY